MKRINLLVLLLVLALPACDVLDTSPQDSLPPDQVFTSIKNLEAALVGAYNDMQGFHDDYTILAELASDNAEHTGSYPSWAEVDNFNMVTTNAESNGQWSGAYALINTANNVITYGPDVPIEAGYDEDDRSRIVAQAKVLRAYAYHSLVRWFGGVPVVLAPSESAEADTYPARATREAVYDQIVKDLTEAEAALGNANDSDPAVIDGYVAKALLARVYLYRQQWQQAAAKAQEVIGAGFALNDLSAGFGGGSEAVWQIPYSVVDANSMAFFAYPSTAGGRYEYAPTADMVAAFDDADKRLPYNIGTVDGKTTIVKYNDPVNGTDPHYDIRLAEMILTRAEALAQLGQLGDATTLLNQIRTRAGLANTTATTQGGLLDAIIAERRLELAFEGHRWHDLVRTGRAVATLSIPDPTHTLWPIPQRDLDLNKNLSQNPGY